MNQEFEGGYKNEVCDRKGDEERNEIFGFLKRKIEESLENQFWNCKKHDTSGLKLDKNSESLENVYIINEKDEKIPVLNTTDKKVCDLCDTTNPTTKTIENENTENFLRKESISDSLSIVNQLKNQEFVNKDDELIKTFVTDSVKRTEFSYNKIPIPKTIYLEPNITSSGAQSTNYSQESLYLMQNPLHSISSAKISPKNSYNCTLDSYRFVVGITEDDEFIYAD